MDDFDNEGLMSKGWGIWKLLFGPDWTWAKTTRPGPFLPSHLRCRHHSQNATVRSNAKSEENAMDTIEIKQNPTLGSSP